MIKHVGKCVNEYVSTISNWFEKVDNEKYDETQIVEFGVRYERYRLSGDALCSRISLEY